MITRTRHRLMRFDQPFLLRALEDVMPVGSYKVCIDEELIEGVSYRLSTHWNLDLSSIGEHEDRLLPDGASAARRN